MERKESDQQVPVAVPQITRQEFLQSVSDTLGTYKWPKGSIESIDPDKTRLVYLLGNRFRGKAEGTWSAKVCGTHKITVNNKEVNIADGTPYSGSTPQIGFDLLVIDDNEHTPYWAKKFTKNGFASENFQSYSSVEASGGVIEGKSSENSYSAWAKNSNEIVDRFMHPIATTLSENTAIAYLSLNVLPPEVIQQSAEMFQNMKFSSRDVSVSSRNSVDEDPTPVLIPFYVLEFQFEGKEYYIAMMADKNRTINGQIPPVKDTDKSPQQIVEEEMPDKIKQQKLLKWGWVLAIVLLIITNFSIAACYLILWGIGYWFIKKTINDRIKELEQEEADNTQKTAELLRKQLIR